MAMTQLQDTLPIKPVNSIFCCYVNRTPRVQIVRINNIPNCFLERTVFPGGRICFETVADAQLEIHSGLIPTAIQADTIQCLGLQMKEVNWNVNAAAVLS